jgi:integrase/recombinase XerD
MRDLLDTSVIWKTEPLTAFMAFVQTEEFVRLGRYGQRKNAEGELRPLRDSSAMIYVHMFGRFLAWVAERRINFLAVTPNDILNFLELKHTNGEKAAKKLNSSIRVRYLRLLERVYTHIGVQPNPAVHAMFDVYKQNSAGRDKAKTVLSSAQNQAFMLALRASESADVHDMADASWKRRRDRALQAMMLGAGLKVSEAIGIETKNVGVMDTTGSVPVTIKAQSVGGTSKTHETQLRPFAVRLVMAWMEERKQRKIPGSLLFPATLQGGRLNKATVYRHVKETLAQAGIEVPRKGGRTLRNTFAIRELEEGQSIELVGQFLGHRKRRSTERYLTAKPTTTGKNK